MPVLPSLQTLRACPDVLSALRLILRSCEASNPRNSPKNYQQNTNTVEVSSAEPMTQTTEPSTEECAELSSPVRRALVALCRRSCDERTDTHLWHAWALLQSARDLPAFLDALRMICEKRISHGEDKTELPQSSEEAEAEVEVETTPEPCVSTTQAQAHRQVLVEASPRKGSARKVEVQVDQQFAPLSPVLDDAEASVSPHPNVDLLSPVQASRLVQIQFDARSPRRPPSHLATSTPLDTFSPSTPTRVGGGDGHANAWVSSVENSSPMAGALRGRKKARQLRARSRRRRASTGAVHLPSSFHALPAVNAANGATCGLCGCACKEASASASGAFAFLTQPPDLSFAASVTGGEHPANQGQEGALGNGVGEATAKHPSAGRPFDVAELDRLTVDF